MTWVRSLRRALAESARSLPIARDASARLRKLSYERRIARFVNERTGRADRLPEGAVYEATLRCNLRCAFCYAGTLLNRGDEWRQELPLEALWRAFPDGESLVVTLAGGEVFMREDVIGVLDLLRAKGYTGGCLTTNGTLVTADRADALARLAQQGFLKHVSISIDGPGGSHDRARGQQGAFDRAAEGIRALHEAARRTRAPLRVSLTTTVAAESLDTLDQVVDVAGDLGVSRVGLNHLMYSTRDEVDETLRVIGESDPGVISTLVTSHPGVTPDQVRRKVTALREKCRRKSISFDMRPKVGPALVDS